MTMRSCRLAALAALVVLVSAGCGGRPVDSLLSDADLCSGPTSDRPTRCFIRCQTKSDCMWVSAGCCCITLVNRAYEELFVKKMQRCEQKRVESGEACSCWDGWDCTREVVCLEGICRATDRCAQP